VRVGNARFRIGQDFRQCCAVISQSDAKFIATIKVNTRRGHVILGRHRRRWKRSEKSGEWKETSSFGPTDLAVVSQLSRHAFQAVTELKAQNRGR
jgi:hypothetical protein